ILKAGQAGLVHSSRSSHKHLSQRFRSSTSTLHPHYNKCSGQNLEKKFRWDFAVPEVEQPRCCSLPASSGCILKLMDAAALWLHHEPPFSRVCLRTEDKAMARKKSNGTVFTGPAGDDVADADGVFSHS